MILDKKNFPGFLWGFAFIAIIAIIDTITGYEIAFSIFYLIPVCYFNWLFGHKWGTAISFCCAILWFFSEQITQYPYSSIWIPYWNMGVRLAFFLIVSFLFSRLLEKEKQIKAAYEEVDKLSEIKSEFTWMVSSQLRHPLASVIDNLQELEKSLPHLTTEQKKRLDLAARHSSDMYKMADDVMNFAALQTRKVDLNLEMEDINKDILVATQFQRTVAEKKGLIIETFLDQSIPKIAYEKESITEVLNMLFSNAINFSDKGKITVRSSLSKNNIKISIQDEGVGIEAKYLDQVFKPFEQIIGSDGRKPQGSGLGLAMTRLIVERHGGKIWIESKPKLGSTVSFTIPLIFKRNRFN